MQDAEVTTEDASPFIIGWKAVTFLDATATLEIQEWLHICRPQRVSLVDHQHLINLNKCLQKELDTDHQNVQLEPSESTHLMPISSPL